MNALQAKLREERRLKKELGADGAEVTVEERCAGLRRRQFKGGANLFATVQPSMHKCAELDDMAGIRSFRSGLHPEPVDATDRWGNTTLILASERGYCEMIEVLLEDGASTCARNHKGQTALHAAVVGGHVEVIAMLLNAGADPLFHDATGAQPAHYAAQADDVDSLKALAAAAGDHNHHLQILHGRMHNGMTPAHAAALFNSPAALRYLHESGCSLLATDRDGETCAHKAARVQALDAIDYLRSVAALQPLQNDEGDTALDLYRDHMAAWRYD